MNDLIVELYLITILWISSFTIVYFTHKALAKKIENKISLFIAVFIPCSLFATVSFAMINFLVRKVNMLASFDTTMIMFLESLPTAFVFGGLPLIYLIYKNKSGIKSKLS